LNDRIRKPSDSGGLELFVSGKDKLKLLIADPDLISVREAPGFHRHAVDESSVAAVVIANLNLPRGGLAEPAMASRY